MVRVAPLLCLALFLALCAARKQTGKKSILDYDEADVERIFQEWEENDEDRDDEDDDFFDPRKPPDAGPLDLEGLKDGKIDPQKLMKLSKKGKPLMLFVGVRAGDPPDQAFTEKISTRWMQSLHNAHTPVQRYIVAPNRVMFYLTDGSLAWDVKDYLITQTDCTTITIEHQEYPCAGSQEKKESKKPSRSEL